ncbi:hypothetical protein NECAME_15336 [Necator americanus]|uniref:Uncharacterized protein n=1 Tax=Necator americanus TaxID=51031 RepID=W2SIA0_NECAM|nr:hypothetical protein NECAME_15336 [Necator americanus]ETN69379.1 hypothetical protein NECAME_15336 [Necator americanus]
MKEWCENAHKSLGHSHATPTSVTEDTIKEQNMGLLNEIRNIFDKHKTTVKYRPSKRTKRIMIL